MSENNLMSDWFKALCFDAYQELTQDGIIAVNRSGQIIDINQKYADVLGIEVKNALGRDIRDVVPITEMVEVMDSDKTDHEVIRLLNTPKLTSSAQDRLVLLSRTPIKDTLGNIIGAVGYLRFYGQCRTEFYKMDALHSQFSVSPEAVFEAAVEKAYSSLGTSADTASPAEILSRQLKYYQEELRYLQVRQHPQVIGTAPAFVDVKNKAFRIAKTSFSVLITGESGTGKEVIADLIHSASDRADKPLITINCAAIPAELLESELFGYVGGAFTGANRSGKLGKIAAANGGSIFLDEIGDMPMALQAKLLRVLENREIEPIGATKAQTVDVRFISATRKNLEQMVAEGTFREDLYFRINELHLHLPPLRNRVEDIPLLSNHLLNQINHKYGTSISIVQPVFNIMKRYHWPGNIRELNNVIKGAYCMAENGKIDTLNLPQHIIQSANGTALHSRSQLPLQEQLDITERQILVDALDRYGHNLNLTARKLNLSRSTLYKKLAKYGIAPRAV